LYALHRIWECSGGIFRGGGAAASFASLELWFVALALFLLGMVVKFLYVRAYEEKQHKQVPLSLPFAYMERRLVPLFLFLVWWRFFFTDDPPPVPYLGPSHLSAALDPNYGVGKGRGVKRKRKTLQPQRVWQRYKDDDAQIKGLVHVSAEEFRELLRDLEVYRQSLAHTATTMFFEDKILLVFMWMMKYSSYAELSTQFGISSYTVSKLIDVTLPLLVEFFVAYIPEEVDCSTASHLSNHIIAIIDATIHPTQKPAGKQRLFWNGHYKTHGLLTYLLIDYEGYIVSVMTNVLGHTSDTNATLYNQHFRQILKGKFALGDPGLHGVDYIVPGYRPSHVKTHEQEIFDYISRGEQRSVEHVNNFIKKCAVLNKGEKFVHYQTEKMIAVVFIICGWCNRRRATGHYE
jgi:hypothetical protein